MPGPTRASRPSQNPNPPARRPVNAQPDPRVPAYLGRILDAQGNPAGTCFQLHPGLLVGIIQSSE
jgi:hypothetical protein